MTVFTLTIQDQSFDKTSSEAAWIANVLRTVANNVQSTQGTKTSQQTVYGVNSAGVANSAVAQYTYTPSGTKP